MREHPITIPDMLQNAAEQRPNDPAIIYHRRGLTVSYSELLQIAHRVDRGLAALGIAPGEHVAVWANNIPEWIYMQVGCALRGAVMVTVNTAYRSFELEYLLRQSESIALFLAHGVRQQGEYLNILSELGLTGPAVENGRVKSEWLPHMRLIVQLSGDPATGLPGLGGISGTGQCLA